MTDEQIKDLRTRVDRLVKILDDDEPGLMVWNDCVNQAWFDVVQWAPYAAISRLSKIG